jgi:hypothetical protein
VARAAVVAGLVVAAAVPSGLAAQFNYFGQNKVQYRDFDWQVLPGEHVDVYFYPEEDEIARLALVYAEESFQILERKFGHTPPRRIPLIIYASHTDFEQTNILPFVPPEGILGVTEFLKQRVAVPFQGNYAEFRHTVRHELVHAFQLSVAAESYTRYPRGHRTGTPLWWSEGIAEFWSAGEDRLDEMVLRELTISGVLPTLDDLNYIYGGVVYPLGGAIHGWLAEEFGEWRVQVLYRDLWKYPSFSEAMEAVYGLGFDELNERYLHAFRRRYFPAVAARDPMGITAQRLAELAIKPAAYQAPGDSSTHLLYLSPRRGYMAIYDMALDRPGTGREVVKGQQSAQFESFHPFASRLHVRNGVAVFTSKYLERDALFFWNLERGEVIGRYQFPELVSILSPAWAPDGQSVIFSGLTVGGISDLYRVHLPDGRLEALTHDRYQDLDPSVDREGRRVVFASDRTPFGPDGSQNLFVLDLTSGTVSYLTYGAWRDESPRWAANDRIYFTSDRNGVFDVYSVDSLGTGRQETATLTGAFDPQWIESERALVHSGFHELSFGIYRSRQAPDSGATTVVALAPERAEPGWSWPELGDQRYARSDPAAYERRFSLDFAAGDAIVAPGVGAATGALFLFSDFLSDHVLFFSVTSFQQSDFGNILENFSGSAFYLNQKRRLNWGLGAFRLRGVFYEGDLETIYRETSFGAFGEVRWPFSRFSRLEAQLRVERSDRFDLSGGDREEPRRVGWLASNYLALVRDNSLWLNTGPIDGERRNLTLGVTNDLSNGRFDSWLAAVDERRYIRMGPQAAYAVRVYGYYSAGRRPRRTSIGGSWGLRGYPRFGGVSGTRAMLINQEIRFPLSDFIAIGFPFGTLRFPGVQGALFGDVGGAWADGDRRRGILGSAGLGLRTAVTYPLVLRFDFGWRFAVGDFVGYTLPPLDGNRSFFDFFFGFNY